MPKLAPSLLALGAALATGAAFAADPAEQSETSELSRPVFKTDLVDFVEKYCIDCHNDFLEEGDRSFDAFLADPNNPAHDIMVAEMLDALNHGTMPKKRPGDDTPMPSDDERRFAVASLTSYLTAVAALEDPAETPLRRLTNVEYRNTIADLLGVNLVSSPAGSNLTADSNVHGLENLAAAQTISLQKMQSYVLAAQEYLDAAFAPVINPLPAAQTLTYGPNDLVEGIYARREKYTLLNAATWTSLARDYSYIDFGTGFVTGDRPYLPTEMKKSGGVPADGIYKVRVTAEAVGRINPYERVPAVQIREPLKLAMGFAPDNTQTQVVHAPSRTTLEVYDVPDDQRQVFEITARMQAGNIPTIYCVNCPKGSAPLARVAVEYYPELIPYMAYTERFRSAEDGKRGQEELDWIELTYKGPRLRIYGMEIEGPYPSETDSAFTTADFRRFAEAPRSELGDVFQEFATQAFRRPVSKSEVAPFLSYAERYLDGGASQIEALKLGFAAVLSSPQFLYLNEGNSETGQALDNYELASRLSYFLWSTMPDEALLDEAAAGRLTNPEVLSAQVDRMLADDRANAFVTGFTRAWLRLDKLGSMPPDERVHRIYFTKRLENAMRRETELVFSEILHENRDPKLFLDSDFTYVNDGLAQLYRLDGEFGEGFTRVSLSDDSPRRGLIGHASILTASANGIDTSPVIRGVWLLENLIGAPPPAAPPDVPAIEPDARGATTLRELLDKHRDVQACRDCHLNIDPYGFPLEVFGPIGELRSKYPMQIDGRVRLNRGPNVDSDTVLPSGQAVTTLDQFRQHLLERDESFKRHLVEKLLAYGTGREATIRDRAEVDRILADMDAREAGLRDLMVMVATSEYFVSR